MPVELEALPVPFACRWCGTVLGESRPDRLTLGLASVVRKTMLRCACGTLNLWRPGAKVLDRRTPIGENQPQ